MFKRGTSRIKIVVAFMLIAVIAMASGAMVFAGTLFENPYDELKTGEYLGTSCAVDSSGNLVLDKRIKEILDNGSDDATETIVIARGGTDWTFQVDSNGRAKLNQLGREIYDKNSIKHRVSDIGRNFSTQADIDGAGRMLSGFQPFISLVTGIILYAVVLGMALFTALDVSYIMMPIFRNKCDDMKQTGNSFAVKTTGTGEAKLRWVSDEAEYAVRTCSMETGKHPAGVYLQKRIWAYIMAGAVIYVLATGNVQILVNIAINILGGVFDTLSKLGQ